MENVWRERLGEPDLRLMGFQLWVHGPEDVDPRPYEDWLRVTAHCGAQGASVWASGEMIQLSDVVRWVEQTEQLHQTVSGAAELAPLEPNLSVVLLPDKSGHIAMAVEITPNHMTQRHRFEFECDQSYLPEFIRQGRALVQRLCGRPAPPTSAELPDPGDARRAPVQS